MKLIHLEHIKLIDSSKAALQLLCSTKFDALFVGADGTEIDWRSFVVSARITPEVLNPTIPIFVVMAAPLQKEVEKARDLGATHVLAWPINAKEIETKLWGGLTAPRSFIAAGGFFGPDRRARDDVNMKGQERRKRTPRSVKLSTLGMES